MSGSLLKVKNFIDNLISKDDLEVIKKPSPKEGESRDEFIDRFMSDDKAVEEFPEPEQRYAVAVSYWEDYQKKLEGGNMKKAVPRIPDFPIASRDREWDSDEAVGTVGRVRRWISDEDIGEWGEEEWSQFRQAHLWYDEDNPNQIGSYKLPYVDIINGEPHIIPRSVFTIAAVLEGAMGGVDLPADDEETVRSRVESLYADFRDEFDDEDIIVPWERENNPEKMNKFAAFDIGDRVEILVPHMEGHDRGVIREIRGVDEVYGLEIEGEDDIHKWYIEEELIPDRDGIEGENLDNPKDYKHKKGVFKAWRCEICNYVYLGFRKPDRCPHCGVHYKYMVYPKDYIHYEEVETHEITEEDLNRALELEVECEALYRKMAEVAENRITESYFRRLARHEEGHKKELAVILGVDSPELPDVSDEIFGNDRDNFMFALEAEKKAIAHYKKSLQRSRHERVKNIFRAFLEVEERHKDLAEVKSKEQIEYSEPTSRQVNVPSPDWDEIEKNLNIEVPAYGNKKAKVAFVGASPSDKDKIRKEPLSGIAGKFFKEKYLEPLGIKKEDSFIINLVPEVCKNEYGILRQPNEKEIQKYSEWVVKKLEMVNPDILIALGKKAYRNLIKDCDFKLPHPIALYKFGDWGEVDRKMDYIQKRLKENKKKVEIECEILKSNDEKQIVYGIVLEPNVVDAHGDFISKDEIEKSCHFFMLNSQMIGYQHKKVAPAKVVESYISPVDFDMGHQMVKKGSWILGVKVLDEDKWNEIKEGKLTGFSIGALGRRYSVR